MKQDDKRINKLLKHLVKMRLQKGYSCESMGIELGLSCSAYHKIEQGKTSLSLLRFLIICEILEENPICLLESSGVTVKNINGQKSKSENDIANEYSSYTNLLEKYTRLLEARS